MEKRSVEKRIEKAERNPAIGEDPDAELNEIGQLLDAIDEECGEGAGVEALGEVVSCMFAEQHGDWSDIPSDLAKDSVFESVEERDRYAAALAETLFSSGDAPGDNDDDGGTT